MTGSCLEIKHRDHKTCTLHVSLSCVCVCLSTWNEARWQLRGGWGYSSPLRRWETASAVANCQRPPLDLRWNTSLSQTSGLETRGTEADMRGNKWKERRSMIACSNNNVFCLTSIHIWWGVTSGGQGAGWLSSDAARGSASTWASENKPIFSSTVICHAPAISRIN